MVNPLPIPVLKKGKLERGYQKSTDTINVYILADILHALDGYFSLCTLAQLVQDD